MNNPILLLYLFNIFTCLTAGIFLLASRISPNLKDSQYHKAKIFISLAIILLGVGKTITLLRGSGILLDLFPFVPLVLASFQACLITFTVLILFHSEQVNRANIIRKLMPTFIFVGLYVIACFFAPDVKIYGWQEYFRHIGNPVVMVRTAFFAAYLVIIVLYVRLFHRQRKVYTGRINNYFSDTDKIRATWGTQLFYEGMGIGISFALVCAYPSVWVDGISTVIMTVFYFSFAIRYINYQYKLFIALPAMQNDKPGIASPDPSLLPGSLEHRLQQLISEEQPFLIPGVVIADLAEKLHTVPRDLSFHINHTYGMNFNTWINTLRVEHAKMLMKQNPGISFIEIAEQSGFSDKTKFSRIFKETTGCLYKEYKKQL